jgi:hypothetical protein
LIIRRGHSPTYYAYLQMFADTNRVPLIVDRRVAERRQHADCVASERRTADRRREPSPTFDLADSNAKDAE